MKLGSNWSISPARVARTSSSPMRRGLLTAIVDNYRRELANLGR